MTGGDLMVNLDNKEKINKSEKVNELLRSKGYKLTTQREAIIDVFLNNMDTHLSPEEVYDIVKIKNPEMGLATVYRALQLFEKLGVLSRLNFDDGCSRYELITREDGEHQHHHLICMDCGKVLEVKLDLLDNLESEIEKDLEFDIVDHNLQFYGYCKDCKKK